MRKSSPPSSTIELFLRLPHMVWAERDRTTSWLLGGVFGLIGAALIAQGGVGLMSTIFLVVALLGAINGLRRPPAKVDMASVANALVALQQAAIPFTFCFGCRKVVPERPCVECDRETEVFQVTTETDRRLVVRRLAVEGDNA